MRFKIDWASLKAERKFTVFVLFYFVFEGNFQVQAPQGAYIRRGDVTEGYLCYEFGGLIFGGAFTRRGLFSEFYGTLKRSEIINELLYTKVLLRSVHFGDFRSFMFVSFQQITFKHGILTNFRAFFKPCCADWSE